MRDPAPVPPPAPPESGAPGTTAVVLATTAAAALRCGDGTLADRLTAQLAALPVRDVHVVGRSGAVIRAAEGTHLIGSHGSRGLADDLRRVARLARDSPGPVAVLAGDLVAHTEALAVLLGRPGRGTGAVVATADGEDPGPLRPPVRVEDGRVVAAGASGAPLPGANGTFRGVLQVGESHLEALAEVAEELAARAERRDGPAGGSQEAGPDGAGTAADGAGACALLLDGLVRAGVPVRAAAPGRLHCDRVAGQPAADAAVRRLAEVDEDRARLEAAVKGDDGFFTTYFVSSWSPYLVRLAAELRLTPNAVTGISVGLAALAAVWFSEGTREARIAGAVLFYLSFVFDCVDGQLARYTRAFSVFGSWLDATFDRVKEYAVYAGLAFGYAAGTAAGGAGDGAEDIWRLAVAALVLQALRHMLDSSYTEARAAAAASGAARAPGTGDAPGAAGAGGDRDAAGAAGGVAGLSRRLEQDSFTRWLKRMIVLPIGERTALIAVTAAVFDARVTFLALLAWGGLATLYMLGGRMGRSMV
ncbi:hypothetical protein GCM10010466_04930 [Planomonospora alba]|uniref:Bifunctional IPC transferase and DIPP synthase n=1 Tax=Planomonospora alba TaxID=161354 RepID=A0ABP6MJS9_9ACTN